MMKFWIVGYAVSLNQPEKLELFEPCGKMEIYKTHNVYNNDALIEKIIVSRCSSCGKIEQETIS